MGTDTDTGYANWGDTSSEATSAWEVIKAMHKDQHQPQAQPHCYISSSDCMSNADIPRQRHWQELCDAQVPVMKQSPQHFIIGASTAFAASHHRQLPPVEV